MILIAVTNYPDNNGSKASMYVHTRNKAYEEAGIELNVLNFSAKNDYFYDGIKVITYETYLKQIRNYNVLILHAANIRNHYRFLRKHKNDFIKCIFFFHGHEVLRINEVYPKPYKFMKKKRIRYFVQDIYDSIKLFIWKKYFTNNKENFTFVFVSKWMKEQFFKWTQVKEEDISENCYVIYNSVGKNFEENHYNIEKPKKYDLITIRSNLDDSKYGIDIVNMLAEANPEYSFLLIGKGTIFNYMEKAENIDWINGTMNHEEMIEILNSCRCALMPTRTDAQGLMMCEMATYGIPVITSDIPVCFEVLGEFKNVWFIDNSLTGVDIPSILMEIRKAEFKKNKKFYQENTVDKEIELISQYIGSRV